MNDIDTDKPSQGEAGKASLVAHRKNSKLTPITSEASAELLRKRYRKQAKAVMVGLKRGTNSKSGQEAIANLSAIIVSLIKEGHPKSDKMYELLMKYAQYDTAFEERQLLMQQQRVLNAEHIPALSINTAVSLPQLLESIETMVDMKRGIIPGNVIDVPYITVDNDGDNPD